MQERERKKFMRFFFLVFKHLCLIVFTIELGATIISVEFFSRATKKTKQTAINFCFTDRKRIRNEAYRNGLYAFGSIGRIGMGPLQESLAKALPPPPPPSTNYFNIKKLKKQATTMQWHDNISSYKCFETIATPSPIPITKGVHRSTSLDSLANSEPNHSDSQDSWCDTDEQSDTISQCDSITDSKEPITNQLNEQESIYEPFFNDNPTKPIITELVKKKIPLKLCENKQCSYRQFEKHHLIDDCAPTNYPSTSIDNTTITINNINFDEDNKSIEQTTNVPFILNKTRRTSVASSGSVSRMETIVEEPIEPKISVKEILARFETLTSLEVGIFFKSISIFMFYCDQFSCDF